MTILFEKHENGIAQITFNRTDVHNAFNEQMISDITAALDEIDKSSDIRIVIVQGEGKSFSAGADLEWMKRASEYSYEENQIDAQKLSYMLNALYSLKQLTIVCAHGSIMGGGIGLLSCADIVLADASSKFALSEVKLGLIPATIAPFVIEAIGPRQAKRFFQTGELFNANKAKSIGLVHEIYESEASKKSMLRFLLKNALAAAPEAMKEAKQLVKDYANRPIDYELRQNSASRIAKRRATEDAREGLKAFFEKREADWVKDV
jgi:methylglutaconyl-CoA hydratase